jgi:hypothetical protein
MKMRSDRRSPGQGAEAPYFFGKLVKNKVLGIPYTLFTLLASSNLAWGPPNIL